MNARNLFQSSSPVQLAVAGAVVAVLWWTYTTFETSRQQFWDLKAELQRSGRHSQQIMFLRDLPDQAKLASHSTRDIAKAIEQSAAKASISAHQISSIEPQAPSRKGDTVYLEHATVVKLDDVTLTSLATLTNELLKSSASIGQLRITSLRVDAPYRNRPQGNDKELWNIEFTLTYYVYSPTSSKSKKG